jgi:hypothetical protein
MNTLQDGIAALRAGKRDEARQLFAAAIREFPQSEQAWQWMYNAANNDTERKSCLEQVLRINPKNEKAAQLLQQLSGSVNQTPVSPTPSIPKPSKPIQNKNAILGAVLVIFVCVLCSCLVFSNLTSKKDQKHDYSNMAVIQCQNFVKDRLKSPGSAEFPFLEHTIKDLGNQTFEVVSYVDSQNSFGALLRTYYTCRIQYVGSDTDQNSDRRFWNLLNLEFE